MALGGEGDFTGKLRLPLPDTFSGNPADWEEWSWNFKACISMFETGAVTLLDAAEARNDEFLDDHLAVTLDTGDVDAEATAARVLFSRKLHYLLFQLVKDSAKLIVRQNEDSNGFETWRQRKKKRNGDHFLELRIQKKSEKRPQKWTRNSDPFWVPLSIGIFPEGSKTVAFWSLHFGAGELLSSSFFESHNLDFTRSSRCQELREARHF